MICHEYKCIYVHIPKTGGHSIMDAFGMEWKTPEAYFLLSGAWAEKSDWIDVSSRYRDYHIFAVVRNPWDRFISGWKYCPSTKNRPLMDVLYNLPHHEENLHDYRHLTATQCDRLYCNGVRVVPHILRFENLQEDFDKLSDMIGKPRVVLKKLHSTEHAPYQEYFQTDESKQIFISHFNQDITAFNYTF